jgi:hypothetical protein
MIDREFLIYVMKYEQNPQYREMARELLELRLLNKIQEDALARKELETNYSMCDDCDMTYPCCNKCIGA